METMEKDFGLSLKWYAACHYNTDNPHAHVVLRGMDEKGEPLIISRDYLSHGVRQIAEQEATIRLGERGKGEVEKGIEKGLKDERFSFLDAELLRMQKSSLENVIKLEPIWEKVREWELKGREFKLKRLSFLESKGLAKEISTGTWRVDDNLKEVLRDLNARRKIERLISPLLSENEARKQELVVHREDEPFGAKSNSSWKKALR